jgi:Aspartyl/Asparaginyl beta-hydroxylase
MATPRATDLGDDRVAAKIADFLRVAGAADLPHGRGRRLLDHLVGTYLIMRRWGQPDWLAHAALIHSVYGTDSYHRSLVPRRRRGEVAAVAEAEAERIAYLFCVIPRGPLFAGTHRWARDLALPAQDPVTPAQDTASPATAEDADGEPAPSRDELDALLLLHIANLAEQAHRPDGTPRAWLDRARELGEFLVDSDTITPPPFIAQLSTFSAADESMTRRAYLRAVGDDGPGRQEQFALAAAGCPVVAEPCVWLAYLAHCRGDRVTAEAWATQAGRRLGLLGAAWDGRLEFDEWLALIDALNGTPGAEPTAWRPGITHPRALFDCVGDGAGVPALARREIVAPDAASGRERFARYIEALADAEGPSGGAIYPDLPTRPWYDPQQFALARYLETNAAAIGEEIRSLDTRHFHRESERIRRTGEWDVLFFYERGRRHNEMCAACPVTTRGIETHSTMRTMAGLIYVSRLRASTHISAHRGPTNLRLRCHLGLEVPDGDCAIRVEDETRHWQEGGCLVFDDHFEHEAWNHTAADRLVLIVDLWHPGLSAEEVRLLEALQGYAYLHARRLGRYWAANAAARARAAD